jgi:hypothetical protein
MQLNILHQQTHLPVGARMPSRPMLEPARWHRQQWAGYHRPEPSAAADDFDDIDE